MAALAAAMVCRGAFARGGCEPEWVNPWTTALPNQSVHAIVMLPDDFPGGGGWIVAGAFTAIGGSPFSRIARWDGNDWRPLGNGVDGPILALTVFDDGAGPALFAGGEFGAAGVQVASRIARWDGSSWSPVGDGIVGQTGVLALSVFDEGAGPRLFAGGFLTAGNGTAIGIARWDGSNWSAVADGVTGAGGVYCLTTHDDGNGVALYAGGNFSSMGHAPATNCLAKWNGAEWTSVGGGIDDPFGTVFSLGSYSAGGANELFMGGYFSSIGGVPAQTLARWSSGSWSELPGLLEYGPGQLIVQALQAHDDGSGMSMFVAGRFSGATGQPSRNIMRWDGGAWHGLGGGVWGVSVIQGDVAALASGVTADGPALLVGGYFTIVNGQPQNRLALWQGCPPSCPADLNGDNLVDFADLNILLGSYNGPGLPGDLDGDDDVDFADLNLLLGAYNSAC